jgi:DNA (cytosine-5)-methyltransferase 1
MTGYNYIDLFHGIGGFALGAYWAGMKFENHFCSDIEPYAQKLYKLRFPDSVQLGDITKIDTEELKQYGNKWIITGGFPCQDISIAGKGAGITGVRSGLWFEYWRLIRDLRPDFAIMENVGALTFRGLDAVLGSLSEIGYNAEWQDIRAEDMGAPHKRERIWIVAYSSGESANGYTFRKKQKYTVSGNTSYNSDKYRQDDMAYAESRVPRESPEWERWKSFGGGSKKISYADGQGLQGRENAWDFREVGQGRKQFTQRQKKCDRENYWSIEPAVGRLVNGLPGRVDRLKGLGNAIVPQIAELLFNQIKQRL